MSDILNGKIKRLPAWDVVIAVVHACLESAEAKGTPVPPDLRNETHWRRRYTDLEQDLDAETRSRPRREAPTGWLLADVTDPFALEVHRPVHPDSPQRGLPVLPAYVAREHDVDLEQVVAAAAEGGSGIAVLVGGSSTGKTRACWEALRLLRERPEPWRLWHPIDPSRPEAALRELRSIGPRTVVWLNEAQFYLDAAADGLGERIAAGLRELLRDPARAPVLVLATLWPQYWDALTAHRVAEAGLHAQARELLGGQDISVPAAFTPDQLRQLPATGDPRLARAAEAAEDGRIIQFLAGAPELMARYRNAPPAAKAVIDAAIDARRLGMGIALPLAFLEHAAPGYLSDSDWDGLGEGWLEQALAYTQAPCKGIRGPLARIRLRTARTAEPAPRLDYRLADYLDQHGRRDRHPRIPPADFWRAVALFADPAELPALAQAAENRGLLRDAARLRKHATAQGDASEAATLVRNWHALHPHTAGPNPAQWAAAHTALDDPYGVAVLLDALRRAGAEEQAAAVLARDPAAHAALDNSYRVAYLLNALRRADAERQVACLAARAVAHFPLADPVDVALLLDALREAGAERQAAALIDCDPAAHVALDNLNGVTMLLEVLREAGAERQVGRLAERAVAHIDLRDPDDVAELLDALQEAGAERQTAALIDRDPAAHAALHDPFAVDQLLDGLWEAGAEGQVARLADRAAAHAPLDNPDAVDRLLGTLQAIGAEQQARRLADRAAAHTDLRDPYGVVRLLGTLRRAGAEEQAAAVLANDLASHVALDNLDGVGVLLDALREAGAEGQVARLADRAAAHAPLDNPYGVVRLLGALQEAGAERKASALIARNPAAHADPYDPFAVAQLLDALRDAGAGEQVACLADRAVAHADLRNPDSIASLLNTLREMGAESQARTLVDRLPAEGCFDLFRKQPEHEMRYRFGRELDGSPALSWGWDDLG